MENLQEIRQNAIEQIKENVAVVASGAPMSSMGQPFEETSSLFQVLACCNLLLSMDYDAFSRNLFFSGCTRRYYLDRSRTEENKESYHLATSRTEAFFDAVVSRHDALASDIVRLSPDDWIPDGEYEEDYCYTAFLHHQSFEAADIDRLVPGRLLDRFEEVLEGDSSPRLDVCRAFFNDDAVGFAESFERLLRAHDVWIQENENVLGYSPVYLIRCRLFIEGLALLALAERAGFQTEREYRFCPSIARLPVDAAWPKDIYEEIDRIAAEERRAPSQ